MSMRSANSARHGSRVATRAALRSPIRAGAHLSIGELDVLARQAALQFIDSGARYVGYCATNGLALPVVAVLGSGRRRDALRSVELPTRRRAARRDHPPARSRNRRRPRATLPASRVSESRASSRPGVLDRYRCRAHCPALHRERSILTSVALLLHHERHDGPHRRPLSCGILTLTSYVIGTGRVRRRRSRRCPCSWSYPAYHVAPAS